jgi:topoisomerase IV subunit A
MTDDQTFAAEVRDTPLTEALGERYLAYALSTIVARSLPDVRDGLKPVHRRLLFAMRELKLDPGEGFKKCARIVGDVMGKYHPHGDQAIYDALVRLAQDFAERYPLVDGQGNFGNLDGDNAAAMRYTEARLTDVAELLLQGLDDDTVDFRATYDGEGREPVVLPAAFPNLLANGAQGIAVGMATSIPPHNVAEVCDALLHLIEQELRGKKTVTVRKLVSLMPGPDFPTGGELIESDSALIEAYKTGRGAFRLRARWTIERQKGGGWQAVVTEIPFQVNKGRLIERLSELVAGKKLPSVAEVRDESAEDVRIVVEPKSRNVDEQVMMAQLCRASDLEVRVPLNMNVLDADRTPRVMSLPEVLHAFLKHRREVLLRGTANRLGKIATRLEILDGYMIAYLNLDEVIRLIREHDDPKPRMMKKWRLTDAQAEAILNMRLRQLRRLDEIEIKREIKDLKAEQKDLKDLAKDEDRQWARVGEGIAAIRAKFGPETRLGRRRTTRGKAPAIDLAEVEAQAAATEREPVTVLCSDKGWIRAVGGHLDAAALGEVKYKEGDGPGFAVLCQSTDRLTLFGSDGKAYSLPVDKLPRGRGFGEPVRLSLDLPNDATIVQLLAHDPERRLIVAASDGRGFVVKEAELSAQTRAGKQVLNLAEGARTVVAAVVPPGADHVASLGENRKMIVFPLAELPEMARGRGITLQKYKDGGLADAKAFALDAGLEVTLGAGGRTRVYSKAELKDWIGQRAQAGRLPPAGFPRQKRF